MREARLILGLDIRAAACGWALLDESASSFVDLGVHALGHAGRVTTLSRAGRHGIAGLVAERARGCGALVVERPTSAAGLELGLAWGAILGVAAMLEPRPRLVTLEPYHWQAEVLLGRRELDEELAYAHAEHLLRSHPRAEAALARLPRREREPAIAAAMIALCGELRLSKHKRVA